MAVRSAKCHFVSEQHWSVQLQEIDRPYCFNYWKEMWHVDASNINLDSMFEMSTGCFLHAWSLLRNDGVAALIWALKKVSPDRLHNVIQRHKCWSALVHLEHRSPYVIISFIRSIYECNFQNLRQYLLGLFFMPHSVHYWIHAHQYCMLYELSGLMVCAKIACMKSSVPRFWPSYCLLFTSY